MTIILCAINAETGEVLNRDGSVAGKVVPIRDTHRWHMYAQPFSSRNGCYSCGKSESDPCHAASRVDLSGCEVKK